MERWWTEKNLRAWVGKQFRGMNGGKRRKAAIRAIDLELNANDLSGMVFEMVAWVRKSEHRRLLEGMP